MTDLMFKREPREDLTIETLISARTRIQGDVLFGGGLHLAAVAYISARKPNRPHAALVWRSFLAALAGLPAVMRSRRAVQRGRKVGALAIARAMTWNPRDLTGRRPVVRAIR